MKLYNVYYGGRSCDSNIPLESAMKVKGMVAECTNQGEEYLIYRFHGWMKVNREEYLKSLDKLHQVK